MVRPAGLHTTGHVHRIHPVMRQIPTERLTRCFFVLWVFDGSPFSRTAQAVEAVGRAVREVLLHEVGAAGDGHRVGCLAPHLRRAEKISLLQRQTGLGSDPLD